MKCRWHHFYQTWYHRVYSYCCIHHFCSDLVSNNLNLFLESPNPVIRCESSRRIRISERMANTIIIFCNIILFALFPAWFPKCIFKSFHTLNVPQRYVWNIGCFFVGLFGNCYRCYIQWLVIKFFWRNFFKNFIENIIIYFLINYLPQFWLTSRLEAPVEDCNPENLPLGVSVMARYIDPSKTTNTPRRTKTAIFHFEHLFWFQRDFQFKAWIVL